MESFTEFIRSNPDPRELKRALAVKMVKQGQNYYQIRDTLGISLSFISKYLQRFEREGIEGLKLKHKGSNGYLTIKQKQAVLDWLKQKNYWQLSELKTYLEVNCDVKFASLQSSDQSRQTDPWSRTVLFQFVQAPRSWIGFF